ncbi:MAG TPA: hypothetical protein VF486_07540 [Actinomycetes bacterium]
MAVTERSRARVIYRQPDQRVSRAAGPAVSPTRLSLLLLALVLFSGGLVIGRGSARSGGVAEQAAQSTASTAAPSPAATAAAPAVPVRSAAGPQHVVAGVGVGFGWAHTEQGAVAAATNYTIVLGSKVLFDQARLHQAITRLAAPRARVAMQRAADEAAAAIRKGLHLPAGAAGADQAVVLTAPLGEKVERYDPHRARVAIWTTGLAGSTTGTPVSQASGVTVVDLEWVAGDWKQVGVGSRPAPTPLTTGDDVPSLPNAFLEQSKEFKEYDYAPRP